MAERAHTPGPWEWIGSSIDGPEHAEVMGVETECGACCQGGWPKITISDADRALILAAPALYTALVEAEAALAVKASLRDSEQARVERALESVRSALASALPEAKP